MRAVIQRVNRAEVKVDGKTTGKINKGYLVFLGVGKEDTEAQAEKLFNKIYKLRIFEDENGKINKSISDIDGEILIVSQFTLYAITKGYNRPGFSDAMPPEEANRLYEYFLKLAGEKISVCQHGIFGADMKVSLENDGPFTICLDTDKI